MPDAKDLRFPDILAAYTGVGDGWVDLRPHMSFRIYNAYFQANAPDHTLKYYLGTQMARFQVASNGTLRLLSLEPGLAQRPYDQPAASDLVSPLMTRFHHHRYHYQITFRSKAGERGAVLLGADSEDDLQSLARRLLADPDSVCTDLFAGCVAFPKTCTVSLEMEVIVNGGARTVVWGSTLASVVVNPRRLKVMRDYSGHPRPVEIPPGDPQALRLPLLPGDKVTWE